MSTVAAKRPATRTFFVILGRILQYTASPDIRTVRETLMVKRHSLQETCALASVADVLLIRYFSQPCHTFCGCSRPQSAIARHLKPPTCVVCAMQSPSENKKPTCSCTGGGLAAVSYRKVFTRRTFHPYKTLRPPSFSDDNGQRSLEWIRSQKLRVTNPAERYKSAFCLQAIKIFDGWNADRDSLPRSSL